MLVSGYSDKGIVRNSNQDAFQIGMTDDGISWAVVCDGMGRANSRDIATRLAADHFSAAIKAGLRPNMTEHSIMNLLRSSVVSANIRVFDKSKENAEFSGMGTTIVACLVIGKTAYFIHAGDSRAYVLSGDEFFQITRDHSIVQSMIEDGKLTVEEARFHPRKNVITRALGVDEIIEPEFNVYDLNEGEIILLCTDGLTNFVADSDIVKILKSSSDNSEKSELLVSVANENGGGDNITAVVFENK